jgi:hypothetical protein
MYEASDPPNELVDHLFFAICRRHYGWIWPAEPPELGPEYAEIQQRLKLRFSNFFNETRTEIARQGWDIPNVRSTDGRDDVGDEQSKWIRESFLKYEEMASNMVLWDAATLGSPGMNADFDHWSKITSFTTSEILWLASGLEPDQKFDAELATRLTNYGYPHPVVPFMQRRKELIDREFDSTRSQGRTTLESFVNGSRGSTFPFIRASQECSRGRLNGHWSG